MDNNVVGRLDFTYRIIVIMLMKNTVCFKIACSLSIEMKINILTAVQTVYNRQIIHPSMCVTVFSAL